MLKLYHSMEGMYEGTLTTADWLGFTEALSREAIPIFQIEPLDNLSYRFRFLRRDWRQLKDFTEKRGDLLKIRRIPGLFWSARSFFKRPVLLMGVLILLVLFLFLPTRVLFIRVTGNREVPSAFILETASREGLSFGASRRKVRSEQVKNRLLANIPQLKWAGVNSFGCVAEIAVQEQPTIRPSVPSRGVTSIVAERDGIIERCEVLKGNLVCRPGQAVVKGQTLISGFRDCGLKVQAGEAEGAVYGITLRNFGAVTPAHCFKRGKTRHKFRKFTWIVGKKRINLTRSPGNYSPVCGRMYMEYFVTLPGGYKLPLALAVDTYWETDLLQEKLLPDQVLPELKKGALDYLRRDMVAGQVLTRKEQIRAEKDFYALKGTYLCREMLGRIRQEKIGVKQDTWNES